MAAIQSQDASTPDLHNSVEVDDIVAYEYLTHHGSWKWGIARIIRLRGKRSVDVEAWDAVGLHAPAPVSDEYMNAVSSSKSKEKLLSPSRGETMPSGLSGVTLGLWQCPPDIPGCAVPLSTIICVLKHDAVSDVTFEVDAKAAQIILRSMWCQRQPLVIMGSPFASPTNSISNRGAAISADPALPTAAAQTDPPRAPTVPAVYGYIGVALASAAFTVVALRCWAKYNVASNWPTSGSSIVCDGDSCVLVPASNPLPPQLSTDKPTVLTFSNDATQTSTEGAVAKPGAGAWAKFIEKIRKIIGVGQV